MKKKQRLDSILLERDLVKDKDEAFVIVTEGRVLVDGQKAVTPAQPVASDARIEIQKEREFVGRGAYKLDAALDAFKIDAQEKICADIGAATGGFVEVLLQRGAKKVYAIDTARGKLDISLREDKRVVVMEGLDVRTLEELPELVDVVTIDVSLVSLRYILPHARRFLKEDGVVVALFKPQYETRDMAILHHGVIRDTDAREKVFADFLVDVEKNGWTVSGNIESPIRGGEGNVEFLVLLKAGVSQNI